MMFRGILHGKRLNRGIAAKKRADLRGDFREHAIVIIFDVGAVLPKRGTAVLAPVGIKRFDGFQRIRVATESSWNMSERQIKARARAWIHSSKTEHRTSCRRARRRFMLKMVAYGKPR